MKRLYEVFARYPASKRTMSACTCCVSDAEIAGLFSHPLAQIPAEKLSRYAAKAMTTWGSERDWKHFLPRLCELALEFQGVSYANLDWIGNKFSLVEWRDWPAAEVEAVRDFWRELTVSVAKTNYWFDLNWWLGELERLGENGEAGLQI